MIVTLALLVCGSCSTGSGDECHDPPPCGEPSPCAFGDPVVGDIVCPPASEVSCRWNQGIDASDDHVCADADSVARMRAACEAQADEGCAAVERDEPRYLRFECGNVVCGG